ncbi:MAG: AraC family ligand binding domain-containing protein, partial [Spirochaetales bacterium]|nr:AraC family ligand binding domain-containing protein [Spirochaetales bacterium]
MQISIKETVFVYMLQDDEEIRWHSRSHKHGKNEYEIHYFIQGEGSFKNASITRAITPGSLFFSTPEDTHSVIPASKDFPVTYYAILFSNECSDKEFSLLLSDIIQNKKNYNVGTNYRFFFEELKDKFLSNNKNRVNSGIHQFISFLYLL